MLQQLQQPFVLAERSTEHLYCTTLLADALNNTARPFQPKWQQVNAPLLSGEYLFPRAFADYPGVEWVYRSADIEHWYERAAHTPSRQQLTRNAQP